MKKIQKLLKDITRLTYNIETNYPELYRTLDENPMTISTGQYPHIDRKILEDYLESLKQLLKHHMETHPQH